MLNIILARDYEKILYLTEEFKFLKRIYSTNFKLVCLPKELLEEILELGLCTVSQHRNICTDFPDLTGVCGFTPPR